jgi:hypothetical protein
VFRLEIDADEAKKMCVPKKLGTCPYILHWMRAEYGATTCQSHDILPPEHVMHTKRLLPAMLEKQAMSGSREGAFIVA